MFGLKNIVAKNCTNI